MIIYPSIVGPTYLEMKMDYVRVSDLLTIMDPDNYSTH